MNITSHYTPYLPCFKGIKINKNVNAEQLAIELKQTNELFEDEEFQASPAILNLIKEDILTAIDGAKKKFQKNEFLNKYVDMTISLGQNKDNDNINNIKITTSTNDLFKKEFPSSEGLNNIFDEPLPINAITTALFEEVIECDIEDSISTIRKASIK